MKSIADIIYEMKNMYPSISRVPDETILTRIKDAEYELYPIIGKETKLDVTVTSDGEAIEVASDFRSDNLLRVLYFDQSGAGGSTVPGTLYYSVDDISTMKMPEFPTYLKFPLQDANYNVATVVYRAVPPDISTNPADWQNEYPVIDDEYVDVLIFKVIQSISLYGDAPDISIHNNYERKIQEKLAKVKLDYYRRAQRNKTIKHSHKDTW